MQSGEIATWVTVAFLPTLIARPSSARAGGMGGRRRKFTVRGPLAIRSPIMRRFSGSEALRPTERARMG
jgi:hypothetical protein